MAICDVNFSTMAEDTTETWMQPREEEEKEEEGAQKAEARTLRARTEEKLGKPLDSNFLPCLQVYWWLLQASDPK